MKLETAYRKFSKYRRGWTLKISFSKWNDNVTIGFGPRLRVHWPGELGDPASSVCERGLANAMAAAAKEMEKREKALALYEQAKREMRR